MLVGINLLREGLDLPEVSLVAILDADKEGFLRSERSLIQTIGRAARHLNGTAILYADTMTDSMKRAISETDRRRRKQIEFNESHGITPQGIQKAIRDITDRVKAVAEEKKLQLVLRKEMVLYGGLDITEDVIAKLNAGTPPEGVSQPAATQ